MSTSTYSIETLCEIIKNSTSIRQILLKLELSVTNGNYRTIKNKIFQHNIDISHFLGKSQSKGQKHAWPTKKEFSEVAVENSSYSRTNLKKRIITDNLLDYKCCFCGITEWKDKKLSLHLHHINGIDNDHRLENLCFLCPNCHSQTESYCGRVKKPKKLKIEKKYTCPICKGSKSRKSKVCSKCCTPKFKIIWPDIEDLLKELENTSLKDLSKKLGVSRNTVSKHIKNYT